MLLGYAHGLAWKVGGLVAKLGFLLLIVPRLPDTVFALYVMWLSAALFGALGVSFAVLEMAPVFVRGRRVMRDRLVPVGTLLTAATTVLFVAGLLSGSALVMAVAAGGCSLSYFYLSGIVRTTEPGCFEFLTNAPPILLLLAALVFRVDTVLGLLAIFTLTQLVCLWAAYPIAGLPLLSFDVRARRTSRAFVRHVVTSSTGKIASNLLLLANFRALATLPVFFGRAAPNDALVIALTVGEACWQVGMVVVNRNFQRYCRGEGTARQAAAFATAACLGGALVCGGLLTFTPPLVIPRFDWQLTAWAVMFFGAYAGLLEWRGYQWARGRDGRLVLYFQLALVAVQIAIILLLASERWLPASAIVALLGTAAIAVSSLVRR